MYGVSSTIVMSSIGMTVMIVPRELSETSEMTVMSKMNETSEMIVMNEIRGMKRLSSNVTKRTRTSSNIATIMNGNIDNNMDRPLRSIKRQSGKTHQIGNITPTTCRHTKCLHRKSMECFHHHHHHPMCNLSTLTLTILRINQISTDVLDTNQKR